MSSSLTWFKSSHSNDDGGDCLEVAYLWRKSSHSNTDGGNCLEAAGPWRKSTHSNTDGGDCVEVSTHPRTVHVRDSKDRVGPQLSFPTTAWHAFITRKSS